MAIDLNFNEQQRLIQETAQQFFASNCLPSVVRKYENSEDPFPRDLWRKMAKLGWLGMCFPEKYEGLGCSFIDLYALYIEFGRHLVPSPHLDTVALGGALVAKLGDEGQKSRILPAISRGEAILSLAIMEPDGLYGPEGVVLAARPRGDGFVLSGIKVLAPYAGQANWLVCPVRTGAGNGPDGISIFLIDQHAPGVSMERTMNMAGYPLYTVTFADVTVSAADALGSIDLAWPALNEEMMKAAVLQSAMVIGAGERVLDITVAYAKERVQFGEPIGKHQAVQYLTTDVAIQGHTARLLALQAAWRIDSGRSFLREASLAKAAANKAAAGMTHASHEVHAGIGFMIDYDLQLYTMRCKHWEYNLGDARYHLERAMVESEGRHTLFEAAGEPARAMVEA
jgi:alkylation response protein AidB-like acyl-CoA dehydrogenase